MPDREPVEGASFGRYQLIERLGRGGTGEVWRAHDTTIDRMVAIRMLPPRYAQNPRFIARFRREAQAAARLDDPHIAPIYDVDEIDGLLCVTMRLIAGRDLASVLAAGPMEPARAVRIVDQIASALNHAHRAGLVHRDVTAAAILVDDNDFAYLDFGITGESATGLGAAEGTPSDDVYGLACVLYECLTGGVPFPGGTVPPPLDAVLAVGLAERAGDRYPTAVDLAAAAQRAITVPVTRLDPAYARQWSPANAPTDPVTVAHRNPRRRTGILLGAVAAVVALVAGGVFFATRPSGDRPTVAAPEPPIPTSTKPPGPPPNTGPLTGVYRADFGPIIHLNDTPGPDPSTVTDTYAIRSTCLPAGCVANAARIDGAESFGKPFVLDLIGDRWFAVGLAAVPCKSDAAAEAWEVLSVVPQPDGTLAGEYMSLTGNDCLKKRTVKLTRTDDVDLDSLPDPTTVTPRVVSQGEAFRGEYLQTRTFPRVGQQQQFTYRVTTHCLRTGDRCISFMYGPNNESNPLVFDAGVWSLFTESDTVCRGATMHVKKTGRYPIPAAPQNPITELSGTGRQDQTAPCAAEVEFTETMTRTGD
jgi:hypothetical protein